MIAWKTRQRTVLLAQFLAGICFGLYFDSWLIGTAVFCVLEVLIDIQG